MAAGEDLQTEVHNGPLREKLIELGANENTASVLLCLHFHGAATSRDLQLRCDIRQPDVSIAISELRDMNLVHYSPRSEVSRGRPAHIYRLRTSLEQSILPFVNKARKRAKEILIEADAVHDMVRNFERTA
jgi:predicted transcriptional regulator